MPEGLRFRVMEVLRDLHVGVKRSRSLARLYVWYPSLSADIEFMLAACNECQQTRAQSPRKKADTVADRRALGAPSYRLRGD